MLTAWLIFVLYFIEGCNQKYRDSFLNNPKSNFEKEIDKQQGRLDVCYKLIGCAVLFIMAVVTLMVYCGYNDIMTPLCIAGLLLLILDLVVSIICYKRCARWKKTLEKEQELAKIKKASESESDEPQFYDDEWDYKCNYCGSLFSKDNYICPFCGAKRK